MAFSKQSSHKLTPQKTVSMLHGQLDNLFKKNKKSESASCKRQHRSLPAVEFRLDFQGRARKSRRSRARGRKAARVKVRGLLLLLFFHSHRCAWHGRDSFFSDFQVRKFCKMSFVGGSINEIVIIMNEIYWHGIQLTILRIELAWAVGKRFLQNFALKWFIKYLIFEELKGKSTRLS